MGDILDIAQTVSGLFLDILDIVECCGSGGDFPGKMGKVLRLVWGSPANAGGKLVPSCYIQCYSILYFIVVFILYTFILYIS